MENYDLKRKNDSWVLQKQGSAKASLNFGEANKTDALKKCSEFLINQGKPTSLHVHKENGTYQEERTFPRKADPRSSRG